VFPLINAAVEFRAPDGTVVSARIAFVAEAYAAVERPADHPAEDVPSGALYDLMWPAPNGVNIQPVSVTERPGRGGTLIWEAAEAGEHRLEQRRAYVRVSLTAPMTVTDLADQAGGRPEDAVLLDVSEAALRCSVQGERWEQMENGSPVQVLLTVDETPFSTRGTVLRTRKEEGDPAVEVIVMFDADAAFTAGMRRAVFAEQRRILAEERAAEEFLALDPRTPEPASATAPRHRRWWQLR